MAEYRVRNCEPAGGSHGANPAGPDSHTQPSYIARDSRNAPIITLARGLRGGPHSRLRTLGRLRGGMKGLAVMHRLIAEVSLYD